MEERDDLLLEFLHTPHGTVGIDVLDRWTGSALRFSCKKVARRNQRRPVGHLPCDGSCTLRIGLWYLSEKLLLGAALLPGSVDFFSKLIGNCNQFDAIMENWAFIRGVGDRFALCRLSGSRWIS